MFQIFDSVTKTCMKYGEDYLPWAVGIAAVFVFGGIVLRVIRR
jgi:hypothetical protein